MTNSRLISVFTMMFVAALLIVAPVPPTLADSSGPSKTDIESSVVKIMVYSNPPNLLSPWQKAGVEAASGSGVIVDTVRGPRIDKTTSPTWRRTSR